MAAFRDAFWAAFRPDRRCRVPLTRAATPVGLDGVQAAALYHAATALRQEAHQVAGVQPSIQH